MTTKFEIVQLPQEYGDITNAEYLAKFARKSKVIRLQALETDPASFSSNYAREVNFDDEVWRSRLWSSAGRTFIVVDKSHLDQQRVDGLGTLELAEAAPWIGTAVLMGPKLLQELPNETTSGEQLFRDAKDVRKSVDGRFMATTKTETLIYVINAVYVSPTYRGHGIAKKILDSISKTMEFDKVLDKDGQDLALGKACFVHVKQTNVAAVKLYESMGYVRAGSRDITNNGVNVELLILRKDS